jgi:NhaP-type Na+/H+ or K+/H+ antiporter
MCLGFSAVLQEWRSEDNFQESILSGALLLWVLGMELMSSGLMAVTFITKLFWSPKYPFWNKYIPTI